jgi:MFS family permease
VRHRAPDGARLAPAPATPYKGAVSQAKTGPEAARPSPIPVVLLTVFLDMVGFSILFPIFPQLLEHYLAREGPDSAIGHLVSALGQFSGGDKNAVAALFGGVLGSLYSLLQFLFAPVWGGLSDRIGRRPTLLVTLLGTFAGYVLWIFAGSFGLLVASRLLCGIAAGNLSTASAVIADVTEGKDRARGMGLLGMSIGLGFILGPLVCLMAMKLGPDFAARADGGAFALHPFSAPALFSTALAAVNLLWIATRFRETLPPERRGESRHARVLNPFAQAKRLAFPGLTRTNWITFLFYSAFSGMEFTLTFLAAQHLGYEARQNAMMFVFAGLVIALVQGGLVRRLVPRLGERRVARAGLVALIPGFVLIGLVGVTRSAGLLYAGLFFMALGSALAMPSLSSLASRYAPDDRQGLALGTNRSLGSLARAVGPLGSSLLYWRIGSGASYWIGAGILLWPLALCLGLPPVPESHAPQQ